MKFALAASVAALVLAIGASQAPAEVPGAGQAASCTVRMGDGTLTYRLYGFRSVRCGQAISGLVSALAMSGNNQISGWKCTGMSSSKNAARKGKCSATWGGKSRSFRYVRRWRK